MPQNMYLFPGLSYAVNSTIIMLNQSIKNPSEMNPDQSFVSEMNPPSDAGTIANKIPRKPKTLSESVMMGALASGIFTAIAPLERVYTLMQCQNELVKMGRLSHPYKGIRDCFHRTIKYDGFFSLWRGNIINLFGICCCQGMLFAASKYPQIAHSHDDFPAGALLALSVMCTNSLLHPLTYTKVRLLNDVSDAAGRGHFSLDLSTKTPITYPTKRLFTGAFHVVTRTFASDGIHGFYRGYTITCLGLYVYFHGRYAAEDVVSKYSADKQNQVMKTILSPAIVSGTFMLSIPALVYPVGTVGKRMMLRSGEANKYKGSIDALTQIIRKEGVGALYKGLTPHLIYHVAKASIISTVLCTSAKLGILMSRDDLTV